MKRLGFYKIYYTVTDRSFADHIVWFPKDRKKAWRKGQFKTSKTERKISLVLQCLYLSCAVVFCALRKFSYVPAFSLLFILSSLITEFSFLWMELLYRIFNRKHLCSALLYQSFLGNTGELWAMIKPFASKKISSIVQIGGSPLYRKFQVTCRKNEARVYIRLSPGRITVISGSRKISLKQFSSPTDLGQSVAEALHTITK